ncbi:MAG: hypothetical protein HC822_09015 [Oscillochloris sp.]|nr:hypothetical protein [Oscillochloris sp.]
MIVETVHDAPTLTIYDRRRVFALLQESTPQQLRNDLRAGRFGNNLHAHAAAQLDDLLLAWEQRALGQIHLRDVLLIDHERGPQVYDLICAEYTVSRVAVLPELAAYLVSAPSDLRQLPAPLTNDPQLAQLAARAEREGLRSHGRPVLIVSRLQRILNRSARPRPLGRRIPCLPLSRRPVGVNGLRPDWRCWVC